MTERQLERAKRVHRKIKELEEFKRAFHSQFENVIKANNYDGQADTTKVLSLSSYQNIENLIKNEVDKMIQELREEFSEI